MALEFNKTSYLKIYTGEDVLFDDIPLYSFEAPITLRIEFNHTSMAEQASLMPHTKRLDGRTLEYVADDYEIVFEAIMAMVWLASTTSM